MANLSECKDCGHQVSFRAEFCPNCGVRKPAVKDPTIGWAFAGQVLLIVIIGGAYDWFASGSGPTPTEDGQDESILFSRWTHSVPAEYVCMVAIGTIMGRDPARMTTDRILGSTVFISYIRADDETHWAYKCRFEGDRVVWGNADGRWRTDPADSVVTFTISGRTVTITDAFDDGSASLESSDF